MSDALVISPSQFLAHWQGHRRVTRRTIVAFPDDKLFTYASGGMRTFGAFANEMLGMAVATVQGVITDDWSSYVASAATTKAEVLEKWDETTTQLETLFPQIPAGRFQDVMTAFGQWKMPGHDLLLYVIDNEIHHRGQGFVYLRELGIEPPPFYDRS